MRKILFALILICTLSVSGVAYASDAKDAPDPLDAEAWMQYASGEWLTPDDEYAGNMINRAIEVLADTWNDIYWEEENPDKEYLLDIRSTRIVCIKDSIAGKPEELFGDVQYVIEFLLYSDYMAVGDVESGMGVGYYDYTSVSNNVVVYKDGHMECKSRVLDYYRSRTFEMDYSTFIDRVIDLHEQFNRVIVFKNHQIEK